MGAALTGMGVLLLLTQFDGSAWLEQGLVWWPTVLILLGLEVLIYLWRSPSEHPILRYDVFSIVFITILGAGCMLLTTASATGIVEEVRGVVGSQEVRVPAADFTLPADPKVKRIVLQGEYSFAGAVMVDAAKEAEHDVQVMGACRYQLGRDEQVPASLQLAEASRSGDTLYVTITAPSESGLLFADNNPTCQVTVVLPADKQVEVAGNAYASLLGGGAPPKLWRGL